MVARTWLAFGCPRTTATSNSTSLAAATRTCPTSRARDRERKLGKKIREALQRIEDDEYGYCDACGIEIGVKRLEARPTATECIDCKTLAEIKEKQLAD